MGEEIRKQHFLPGDWSEFQQRLELETLLLRQLGEAGVFSEKPPVAGCEIECWLVDEQCRPAPLNDAFLDAFQHPLASAELATFNVELNTLPQRLQGAPFQALESEIGELLRQANASAASLDARLLLTGILPTAEPADFGLQYMSHLNRYRLLNQQVLKARHYAPIELDIEGPQQTLKMRYDSVMLEAATTSFQLHIQAPWSQAHHYYNASLIVAAPLLAVSANSPLFFGKTLWEETRIPVFEQTINLGQQQRQRVTFGSGYALHSIAACFEENLQHFPLLLPMLFDSPSNEFRHLRLHNGVIWRWNRPLVGFDDDATPHIRIEHRPLPAGPTLRDMMANAVLFYGLCHHQAQRLQDGETLPEFRRSRENFYTAARHGLQARLDWQRKTLPAPRLIEEQLLPLAQAGLKELGIDSSDSLPYLDIIANRNASGQNGAVWQRRKLAELQGDLGKLTAEYLERQRDGQPVHTWN